MWNVNLKGVGSSSKEHFPNLLGPQTVSSGASLGTDMPQGTLWELLLQLGRVPVGI